MSDIFVDARPKACGLIVPYLQGGSGTARTGGPADLWHGPARKIMARKILARPGTENLGTEKYWHGTDKYHISLGGK